MKKCSRHLLRCAHWLVREIGARAVVIYADAVRQDEELRQFLLEEEDFPVILVTRSSQAEPPPGFQFRPWVTVPDVSMTRGGQVKAAVLACLARGLLRRGDRIVCVAGMDGAGSVDGLGVLDLASETELFSILDESACPPDVAPEVFEQTFSLAAQLSAEGREGRPVGALFVLGDSERVLKQSRSLVLNPFHGHPESQRNILDPALAETIKEFAALDGAFVVRGDGVVLTAGTQLVPAAAAIDLPAGLGTRHAAAAAITASTGSLALCVSQSTGAVTVFRSGRRVTDIPRQLGTNRRGRSRSRQHRTRKQRQPGEPSVSAAQ
jgi:hypothetical protein